MPLLHRGFNNLHVCLLLPVKKLLEQKFDEI